MVGVCEGQPAAGRIGRLIANRTSSAARLVNELSVSAMSEASGWAGVNPHEIPRITACPR